MRKIFSNFIQILGKKENFQNVAICLAAVTSGFVAVVYAKCFRFADLAFAETIKERPFSVFFITPLLFLFSWMIIRFFSPEAGGSGIPQVLAAHDMDYESPQKSQIDRLLSGRVILYKILSSILCIFGGGAIGREGPTLQISASLFHLFGKKTRQYFPETSSQLWIVSGAAAGLAAAFNTPLGGIVYAIEELGSKHFLKVRSILLTAVIISGLMAQAVLGDYLFLGSPQMEHEGWSFLPLAILTGVLSGLLGAIFARLLFFFAHFRFRIRSTWAQGTLTLFCGFVMAGFIFLNHKSAGSGIELINDFLFRDQVADLGSLALRFFGTMVTYLSGSAGGIFSPSLAIGGCLGSYLSAFFGFANSHLFVLMGMTGFLTGVTRIPFTSFILVLEMTNEHSAIFPLMTAALFAQLAASFILKHSFYEMMKSNWLKALS